MATAAGRCCTVLWGAPKERIGGEQVLVRWPWWWAGASEGAVGRYHVVESQKGWQAGTCECGGWAPVTMQLHGTTGSTGQGLS